MGRNIIFIVVFLFPFTNIVLSSPTTYVEANNNRSIDSVSSTSTIIRNNDLHLKNLSSITERVITTTPVSLTESKLVESKFFNVVQLLRYLNPSALSRVSGAFLVGYRHYGLNNAHLYSD